MPENLKVGDWIRVKTTSLGTTTRIGQVVGFSVVKDNWPADGTNETVIIENRMGRIEVFLSYVVGKIDPVKVWQECYPGEPISGWLKERL